MDTGPDPIDSGTIDWQIVHVDYWEQDAILILNGKNFYFQWSTLDEKGHLLPPTLDDALKFLFEERKV